MANLYSICLIPQQEDKKYLDGIIVNLAKKYGAYPFIPHLTIYGGVVAPEHEIKEAVDWSLVGIKPLTIQVNKLDYSDIFSKTLFIEMKMNPTLQSIHQKLQERLKKYRDYLLKPHISLIYKNGLANEEKKKIIDSLDLKKEIMINRCTIIAVPKEFILEEDVNDWQIVYDVKI